MSNNLTQAAPYTAEEGAPHSRPIYAYVIQHEDGTSQFFTSMDRVLTLVGLPDEMAADDPQDFTPCQIRHGSIKGGDRFELNTTTITVTTENTRLRRFLLFAAAVRLKAWIIRVNLEDLIRTPAFAVDAVVVQSGILGKFGFRGNTIAIELTPEPYFVEGMIPRFYYGRSCQHALYGEACGVDRTAFNWTSTILALDAPQRTLTLAGQRPASPATFFNAGQIFCASLGVRMAVAYSSFNGSDTDLKLAAWNPEFEAGQTILAEAGCLHTVAACRTFSNVANYGGFPDIPDKSPLQGL